MPQGTGSLLQYVPALVTGTPVAVASSCSLTNNYQSEIAGCDQTTAYACGTTNGANADLTENPLNPAGIGGDTPTGATCLTNNSGPGSARRILRSSDTTHLSL